MAVTKSEQAGGSQSDKFKEAARELECDEDEKAWEDKLRKVASQKPAPETPSDA